MNWLPLLLVAGCEQAPLEAYLGCEDVRCRQENVEAAYEADPEQVRAHISGLEDEFEQNALVAQLAKAYPKEAGAICEVLPAGSTARINCDRKRVRPHLYTDKVKKVRTEPARRPAPGPSGDDLPVPDLGEEPWADVTDEELAAFIEGCGDTLPATCAEFGAEKRAREGDLRGVGVACLAAHPQRDKQYAECLFRAAEESAAERKSEGMPDAIRLCSHAGFTGPMCLAHSLQLSAPAPPPAHNPTQDRVDAARAYAEMLRESTGDEAWFGTILVDRFWAMWVHSAYAWSEETSGDLLDYLPTEARPHVTMSATYWTLKRLHPNDRSSLDLAETMEQAAQTLKKRSENTEQPKEPIRVTSYGHQAFWTHDKEGEGAIPSAYCMGPGRRAVSRDPEVDLQIAALEAGAHLIPPAPAEYFLGVLDSERDPVVRWTAARLVSQLHSEETRGLSDSDPLVDARLSPTPDKKKGKKPPPPEGERPRKKPRPESPEPAKPAP